MLSRKIIVQVIFPPLLLVLVTLLLYSNTLYAEYHFDDHPYIIDSTEITSISETVSKLKGNFFRPDRLLVTLSFAINYHIHKLELPGYHLINIVLHSFNGVLIFYLLQYLALLHKAHDKEVNKRSTIMLALAVALLFVCHPVAVNSVTYITQRHVLLATFFYLFGFLSYVKGRHATSSIRALWFTFCIFSFWSALHCKPMTLMFPFALLAYEIVWISRTKQSWKKFSLWCVCLSMLLLGALAFYAFKAGLFSIDATIVGFASQELWTPWEHFLTESIVFLHYWKILFLPLSIWLSADHYFNVIESINSAVAFSWILHVCVALIAIKAYLVRLRFLAFGILWFYTTLIPPYLILPIQDVMVDYKTYLPSFAVACISMECAQLCLQKYSFKPIFFIASILLASFTIITLERNTIFMTEESFWSDVIDKYPNEPRPYNNRGLTYHRQGKYPKAITDFHKAISLRPNYNLAYANLGDSYQKTGNNSKALENYKIYLDTNPNDADTLVRIANTYAREKKWGNAIELYEKSIADQPRNTVAIYNLALAYGNNSKLNKSLQTFNMVLKVNDSHIKALTGIGAIHYQKGHTKTAIQFFEKSLSIKQSSDALYNLTACQAKLGQLDEAKETAKRLVLFDPARGKNLLLKLQTIQ